MKPILIYDGDCGFCRRWVLRWKSRTGDAVEYAPSQEAASRFPRIPPEEFRRSVQLIEPDGRVFSGAEAVFKTLAHSSGNGWPLAAYQKVPGFAFAAEKAYAFVARHREFSSRATHWLWGDVEEAPEYGLSRWIFLRLLGLIYLIAFASLWLQIDGLIGSSGISPASQYLKMVSDMFPSPERWRLMPTLFWLDSSDAALHLACGAGGALSVLLILGIAPRLALAGLWVLYLSLAGVGQEFLSYQWDNLLLETGFLAIFLAPGGIWPRLASEKRPSRAALWALRILLFKLMFSSGCVKLLSGDPAWRNLTALRFHYQTQPLPTWIGWWAHQMPGWFQALSAMGMFAVELGCPFLVLLPRAPRLAGAAGISLLMLAISLTGNYCFFPLLALSLCLLLLDDARWRRLMPRRPRAAAAALPRPAAERGWKRFPAVFACVACAGLSAFQVAGLLFGGAPARPILSLIAPFRTVNQYGLFAVMTTTRPEIIIEGSSDGKTWLPYEFKWKPGDLGKRPAFVEPFQPRLDWQMWFAALETYRENPWFLRFMARLLQNSPSVRSLLKWDRHGPFAYDAPAYVRATVYEYRFTDANTRRETGRWWQREPIGAYCPALSMSPSEPPKGAR